MSVNFLSVMGSNNKSGGSKKQTKIAHFHCSYVYSGGGERISLEQVLGLRKKGYLVEAFAPAIDRQKCFPELIAQVNPHKIIPDLPKWFPARDAVDLGFSSLLIPFQFLRFRKYDIFIGANQPGVWFAYVLSKILNKPFIIYLNQPNRMIYPRNIDLQTGWTTNLNFQVLEKLIYLIHPVVRFLDRLSVRAASLMLVNGHYIGDVISQIYAKDYVDCPAGADPFPQERILGKKEDFFGGELQLSGFRLRKPYILLTNRHYPQKKFEFALESAALIRKKHPSVNLAISGAFTSYTKELIRLCQKLKIEQNVIFLGEVSEKSLASVYKNATVYVYTSPEEDYGMGVVEAERLGVPVVAWNHAGPTVTIVNGKTGFLAKPYSVKDFSEKITKLLENKDLRMKMGKSASSHVQKYFTWKSHIAILEESINKSLK